MDIPGNTQDPAEILVKLVVAVSDPNTKITKGHIAMARTVCRLSDAVRELDFVQVIANANPDNIENDDIIKDVAESLLKDFILEG